MANVRGTNKALRQIGVSGLNRYAGYVNEEFLPELRYPRAAKIYHEMSSNDAVIGAILYCSEIFIRNVDWSVEPASKKKADVDAAKFVEECLHDMDTSFDSVLTEILSMFVYGFSFHEIIYKIRKGPFESNPKYKSNYTDGRIGWRGMPTRAQSTLHEWEFNEEGDVTAFVQLAPPDFRMSTIPMTKGLLFRTRVHKQNPEGKSLLRNAYRSWYFKKRIEEIEAIGIERDLAGLPTITAPEGLDLWNDELPGMSEMRANAEAIVQNVRRDAAEGVLLPHGWEIKLLSTGGARQFDTNAIVNRYDNRIAITMLSDIILLGSNSGSFALADNKQSILATALEAQLYNIADVFNHDAIPMLLKLNSFEGLTGLPKLVPGQVQVPDIKELSLLLRSLGLDISNDQELQNYLRKVAGLPKLDDKTFKEVYYKEPVDTQQNVATPGEGKPGDKQPKLKDTNEKALEQNDTKYTGQ